MWHKICALDGCDNTFDTPYSRKEYCCEECALESQLRRRLSAKADLERIKFMTTDLSSLANLTLPPSRECLNCGGVIPPKRASNPKTVHCSDECAMKYSRCKSKKLVTVICKMCGDEFTTSRGNQVRCAKKKCKGGKKKRGDMTPGELARAREMATTREAVRKAKGVTRKNERKKRGDMTPSELAKARGEDAVRDARRRARGTKKRGKKRCDMTEGELEKVRDHDRERRKKRGDMTKGELKEARRKDAARKAAREAKGVVRKKRSDMAPDELERARAKARARQRPAT